MKSDGPTTNDQLRQSILSKAFIIAILCLLAGAVMAFVAPPSSTIIRLFGQSMNTSSIGLAVIFIGAVLFMYAISRILVKASRASQR